MGSRKLEIRRPGDKNSMRYLWQYSGFIRTFFNFCIIHCAKYVPCLEFKRDMLGWTGMKLGRNCSIGLCAMFDIFFPQLIEIGENSIIGYNATILAHEYLIKEMRTGRVKIGKNVMVGANCTVLAGVEIGDDSVICAGTLVDRDIPAGSFAKGNPMKVEAKR